MCAAPGSKVTDQLLDQFTYLIRTQRQLSYSKHYTQTILPLRHQHPPASSSPTTATPEDPIFSFTNPPAFQVPLSCSLIWTLRFIRSFGRRRPKNAARSKDAESTLVRPYPLRRAVQRRWHAAKEHWHLETLATLGWERSAWVRFRHKTSEHASPLTTFSKASGSYPSTRREHARAGGSHCLLHLFPEPRRK